MKCKHCGEALMDSPEYSEGEWFIRCLDCGVKNLVAIGIEIIGWRK